MPDREKVIRGLECCAAMSGDECRKCPYGHECRDTDLPYGMPHLAADALALLREQEARVLTLDQVCGGDECWIEYKLGGYGYADVYFSSEPDGTALVYRCSPVRDRKPETVWFHDYGKLWRGWSYRPSLEQMRETPWEGESDAE